MKRILSVTLFALIAVCPVSPALHAQQAPANSEAAKAGAPRGETPGPGDANLDAIKQTAIKFAEAFDRGDAKAIAELWTPDGEYIDEQGQAAVGREAIANDYADFFAANPKAKLRLLVDSVRLLSDAAAMEDGRAVLEPSSGATPTSSNYSVVHVKVDGHWLMASVRDAHVPSGSAHENIVDLEWLIGTWSAEEQGVNTESVCSWICDKNFVERKYTTKGTDGVETSGVQIIGWNGKTGNVQSWNFSPDGAFAVGVWSPTEGGWQASVSGVTVDGASTRAVNHLQRLDDNAYVWQSVQRSLDGSSLPDSAEVIMRRTPQK